MAQLAKVGSENGPAAKDTGPQKLAVTNQTKPGLPKSGGGSRYTGLIAGTRVGKR
jgi:hypothetical protein